VTEERELAADQSAEYTIEGRTQLERFESDWTRYVSKLHYALVFLVIALIAAVFGFGGIAAGAAGIAKVLFVVFLIGAIVTFLMNGRSRI
jgi:uncharacterized membrane protein YtjA (UPF0391 family)